MQASSVQVDEEIRDVDSPWLVTYGGGSGEHVRMRIFCFHYSGATASIFRSWQGALPESVQIIAIQLPGREYRLGEPLLTNMKDIAPAVADILPPLLDKPYVIFGHSMGVLLSFDVVQLLRARGFRPPELFIASGRNSPQFRWRDAGLEALPDDEFIAAVRDYNGTPEALLVDEALRDLWLPRLRADLTVSATYEYVEREPLDCPVVVLIGESDPLATDAGKQGWFPLTTGGVRFYYYPGDHFFLHSAERLVLDRVNDELQNLLGQEGRA